ncbi:MAG TPA: DUF3616 domain-containing protein [Aldersonia sp.]
MGKRRFVFVDNHDPGALYELSLDADGMQAEPIRRRPLAGLADGQLGDPEGLARVDLGNDTYLVVVSSLSVRSGRMVNDGLVRVRYTPAAELHAEAMDGFRAWLLDRVPDLAAERKPDDGGLNVEGVAWDSRARALVLGLRSPAQSGSVTVIRIAVDGDDWTTASLQAPTIVRIRVPGNPGTPGVRDLCHTERDGFLILLGRSISGGDEPFSLCTWDGEADEVEPMDVVFHKGAKPEGVTTFDEKILLVDDGGGFAVLDRA